MAIDYGSLLSADQKRSIIDQRIAGFAAEAYQHELNKQIAEQIGNAVAIEQADAALATLEVAISTYQAEAATIPAAQAAE